jgi:hypothetical protein
MSTEVSKARDSSIIIALIMEVALTSETSVAIEFRTRQYIPEDFELHTCRRENLKSHMTQHFRMLEGKERLTHIKQILLFKADICAAGQQISTCYKPVGIFLCSQGTCNFE